MALGYAEYAAKSTLRAQQLEERLSCAETLLSLFDYANELFDEAINSGMRKGSDPKTQEKQETLKQWFRRDRASSGADAPSPPQPRPQQHPPLSSKSKVSQLGLNLNSDLHEALKSQLETPAGHRKLDTARLVSRIVGGFDETTDATLKKSLTDSGGALESIKEALSDRNATGEAALNAYTSMIEGLLLTLPEKRSNLVVARELDGMLGQFEEMLYAYEECIAVRRCGFLIGAYTVSCWWFEIYDLIRRLVLTSVISFVQPRSATQVTTTVLICFATLVLFGIVRPFAYERVLYVAYASYVELFLVAFVGLLLKARRRRRRRRCHHHFSSGRGCFEGRHVLLRAGKRNGQQRPGQLVLQRYHSRVALRYFRHAFAVPTVWHQAERRGQVFGALGQRAGGEADGEQGNEEGAGGSGEGAPPCTCTSARPAPISAACCGADPQRSRLCALGQGMEGVESPDDVRATLDETQDDIRDYESDQDEQQGDDAGKEGDADGQEGGDDDKAGEGDGGGGDGAPKEEAGGERKAGDAGNKKGKDKDKEGGKKEEKKSACPPRAAIAAARTPETRASQREYSFRVVAQARCRTVPS